MTAPVIEVMEAAVARLGHLSFEFARMTDRHGDGPACRNRANDLNEAINVVSELIETQRELLIEAARLKCDTIPLDTIRRANAALARVSGGAP